MLPNLNSVSLSVSQRNFSEKNVITKVDFIFMGSKVATSMPSFWSSLLTLNKGFKTVTSDYGKHYEQTAF